MIPASPFDDIAGTLAPRPPVVDSLRAAFNEIEDAQDTVVCRVSVALILAVAVVCAFALAWMGAV